MNRRAHILTEQSILFLTILKWLILATLTGIIVGLSTTAFLKALQWTTMVERGFPFSFLLLPLAMAFSVLIVKHLAPEAEGHGTEKVIEAVHKHSGRIPAAVVPVKLVATLATLVAGGSVGKEGPCAQIGAGSASVFADLVRFNDYDRRKLVICGISAGFASVFGTPISGAIFGVEVLFIGSILYDVLLPSFVAGIISYEISAFLGVTYFHRPIEFAPVFTEWFFLQVMLLGIFSGIWSIVLIGALHTSETLAKRMRIWQPLRGGVGGFILIVLTFVFTRKYLGLGLDTIEAGLMGRPQSWSSPLVKSIFTGLTLGFGGSGGIVTPIFFIGATSGTAFAHFFGLDISTFAALGMTSVLAGAAQTPIAASVMAMEMFGPGIAPYAAVACVISFLMTGHRSVYPSQVLAVRKSMALNVAVGEVIENVEARYEVRGSATVDLMMRAAGWLQELARKIGRRLRPESDDGTTNAKDDS